MRSRTLAIALMTTTASLAAARHAAHAALDQQFARLGDAMLAIAPTTPGRTDLLNVNGARFEVSTEVSRGSPAEEVTRFLEDCDAQGEAARGVAFTWPDGQSKLSVCVAPRATVDQEDLLARLARVANSSDLSDLGELRMLRAMASAGGSALVRLRGLGSISLRDMLPQEGDAAGEDLPGLPRPAGSRRLLSALSDNRRVGVAVYDAPNGEAETRAAYRTSLQRAGLSVKARESHLQVTSARGDAYAVGFSPESGRTQVAVVAVDLVR